MEFAMRDRLERCLGVVFTVAIIVGAAPAGAAPGSTASANADDVEQLRTKVAGLERQAGIKDAVAAETEQLRLKLSAEAETHRKVLQEQTEKHIAFIDALLSDLRWAVGAALTILLGLIAWMGIRTSRDLKDRLGQVALAVESKAEERLRQLVDVKLGDFGARLDDMAALLGRESAYRACRVAILGPTSAEQPLDEEHRMLAAAGMEHVRRITDVSQVMPAGGPPAADLLVVHYPWLKARTDQNLPTVLAGVARAERRIPVVIYAPGVRVEGEDGKAVSDYGLATHANTPLTLATNIYPLAHVGTQRGGN